MSANVWMRLDEPRVLEADWVPTVCALTGEPATCQVHLRYLPSARVRWARATLLPGFLLGVLPMVVFYGVAHVALSRWVPVPMTKGARVGYIARKIVGVTLGLAALVLAAVAILEVALSYDEDYVLDPTRYWAFLGAVASLALLALIVRPRLRFRTKDRQVALLCHPQFNSALTSARRRVPTQGAIPAYIRAPAQPQAVPAPGPVPVQAVVPPGFARPNSFQAPPAFAPPSPTPTQVVVPPSFARQSQAPIPSGATSNPGHHPNPEVSPAASRTGEPEPDPIPNQGPVAGGYTGFSHPPAGYAFAPTSQAAAESHAVAMGRTGPADSNGATEASQDEPGVPDRPLGSTSEPGAASPAPTPVRERSTPDPPQRPADDRGAASPRPFVTRHPEFQPRVNGEAGRSRHRSRTSSLQTPDVPSNGADPSSNGQEPTVEDDTAPDDTVPPASVSA